MCIQGLRYAAMLIDQVSLVDAPKGGRVAIAGPSFEYFASPEFHGTDSFTLQAAHPERQRLCFSRLPQFCMLSSMRLACIDETELGTAYQHRWRPTTPLAVGACRANYRGDASAD